MNHVTKTANRLYDSAGRYFDNAVDFSTALGEDIATLAHNAGLPTIDLPASLQGSIPSCSPLAVVLCFAAGVVVAAIAQTTLHPRKV